MISIFWAAVTTHRAECNELHELVISAQNADAQNADAQGVRGEHDNERHIERHQRPVENKLHRHHTTRQH